MSQRSSFAEHDNEDVVDEPSTRMFEPCVDKRVRDLIGRLVGARRDQFEEAFLAERAPIRRSRLFEAIGAHDD